MSPRSHTTSVASALAASVIALVAASPSTAQEYPERPVRVIVPWPPGQATDIVARVMAEKMAPALGQPLVVETRPGAAGTLGTEHAAKSPPDGYTLLAASSGPISIAPQVQKVPYEPQRDFEPVCLIASNPYVLVVHPSVPATNVQEFVSLLKAGPGRYSFATSGTASTSLVPAGNARGSANEDRY
ncbi:MAG: tripartite tricarboxylate transporter substrate binding protein [Burkholderiales bacterium]|nr:tripartite tricarboxylate transporter substrate binding protein [Burkholderiales bacterium]